MKLVSGKRFLLLVTCFAFISVIGFVLFAAATSYGPSLVRETSESCPINGCVPNDPSKRLVWFFAGIRTSITRVFVENEGMHSENEIFEKIDFSRPEENRTGKDSDFLVFKKAGQDRSYIKFTDAAKQGEFIYTIGNRVEDAGTDLTDLVILMPNVFESVCKDLEKNLNGNEKIEEIHYLNLTPTPGKAMGDVGVFPHQGGCVKFNGDYYFYHLLRER